MLIVRSNGVRLYRCRRGRFEGPLDFGPNDEGIAAFERAVLHEAALPMRVLVDVVEEDFQWEEVPHVGVWSRRSMLAARGSRRFAATPYVYARREGRAREGRRDDRVRYAAVVAPERLERWLDVLLDGGVRLAGVHSLPIVSTRLLTHVAEGSARTVLVTLSGGNGLRQTFFDGSVLVTTRLASLSHGPLPERVRAIATEVHRFRRHIERSGSSVDDLNVRVVASGPLVSAIRGADAPGDWSGTTVEARALERSLGARVPNASPDSEDERADEGTDRLFALLALRRPLRNHYAPPSALVVHRTRQASRALCAMSLAALGAGGAAGGASWHLASENAAAARDMRRAAGHYEVQNREAKERPARIASESLRLAIETARELEVSRTDIHAVLRPISVGLQGFPDFRLESLEWSAKTERWPDREESELVAGAARFFRATLRGSFEPFHGHYQAAVDEVYRFSEVLAALPGLTEVEVIEIPRERSSGGVLQEGAARFAVALVVDVLAR